MSYARFGEDSDVYVYATDTDSGKILWCCCGCHLDVHPTEGEGNRYTQSPDDMIRHLRRHEKAGHQVPARAVERLQREAAVGYPDPVHEAEMRAIIEAATKKHGF